jgi:hypothetical protein
MGTGGSKQLKFVHIVPGLDQAATEILQAEHARALESLQVAAELFSKEETKSSIQVVEICDPEWEPSNLAGISVVREPVGTLPTGVGSGIRPILGSFFPQKVVEDADFVLFSNSDICVRPTFYRTVHQLIVQGNLAGSIHRATILGLDPRDSDSNSQALRSENWYLHPGSDCFFFPKATANVMRKSTLLMGVPPVGRHILLTLSALNRSFKKFPALGITFHYGDDRTWKTSFNLRRLAAKNTRRAYGFIPTLLRTVGLREFFRALLDSQVVANGSRLALIVKALERALPASKKRR